ncbi:hypothetical protein LB523_20215 [Mesorhizobium sp. ESP-6-4]|uniref:hypothetical protein n=1 Tax=Mesorhizobium sp. ESP-6-4 TaxID=2876624 RepID=UPI001CCEA10E|nr:hypothetical protein [Mesorhizobium sp. ESP-6-4]MBZ9661373.1 hypothetical protein [Mesorhizobium sp. ESP-6-4]
MAVLAQDQPHGAERDPISCSADSDPPAASANSWNDFFFPLVLITSDNLKTLPQGLTVFVGEFTTDWGVLFTGLTLAAPPISLLDIVLSKQFISGIKVRRG